MLHSVGWIIFIFHHCGNRNDGTKELKNDNFVFEEIQKCLKTALYYPAFVGEELDIFLRISGGARISIAKLRRKYHSGEILPDFMLNVVSNSPTDKHLNLLLSSKSEHIFSFLT